MKSLLLSLFIPPILPHVTRSLLILHHVIPPMCSFCHSSSTHYRRRRFKESKCTYGACHNVSSKEATRSLSSHIHLEIGKELDICKSRCIHSKHSSSSSLPSLLIESSFVTIVWCDLVGLMDWKCIICHWVLCMIRSYSQRCTPFFPYSGLYFHE